MKKRIPYYFMIICIMIQVFSAIKSDRYLQIPSPSNSTSNNTVNNSTDTNTTKNNSTTPTDSKTPVVPTNSTPVPPASKSDFDPLLPTNATNTTSNNSTPAAPPKAYVDILTVNIYKSNLTKSQRDGYMNWTYYKNSFSANTGQLSKMTKYFEPESPIYYTTIYKSGWPFYLLSAVFGVLLVIYLIMRFLFKYFKGPKSHITSAYGYSTWGLIVVGLTISLLFFSMAWVNSSKTLNAVNSFTKRIEDQSVVLIKTVKELNDSQIVLDTVVPALNGTNKNLLNEFTTKIYKYEDIKNEMYATRDKAVNFGKDISSKDSSRHTWEISVILIIPFITIGALVAYRFKKTWIVLVCSILVFIFIMPACAVLGLNTSYFLVSIDFCQDINKYISTSTSPSAERGFGFYVSCPSKTTLVKINTAKYEIGARFNFLLNYVNSTLISDYKDNIGIYKRNNTKFLEYALKYSNRTAYGDRTDIVNSLFSLKNSNDILKGLNALSSCQFGLDVVNYIEEKYCYRNMDYIFSGLIYYLFGILGLILLTVGINKLIVLLNPAFRKLVEGADTLIESEINS